MKNKRIKLKMICVAAMLLMTGCGRQGEIAKPYDGNLNRILSEIDSYQSDKMPDSIEGTRTCKAEKYTLDLELDTEQKILSGTVIIDLINETEDRLDKICLRNYASSILEKAGTGKSVINNVRNLHTKEALKTEIKPKDSSVIYIQLKEYFEPGESMTLCFEFITDIPKQDDRFGYHKEGEKYSFLLTYCFPVVSMYKNGEWTEYPYISHAESNYHTVTDYEVTLKTPKEYVIAATGEEHTRNSLTTIKAKNIRDLAIVASNQVKMETVKGQGVDVNLYYLDYENTKGYNEISLLAGKDSLNLYTNLIGEYAYDELDIIQCFYSSAMEYPGLVLIGLPDLKSPEEIDDKASYEMVCSRIAHEVAHQWFFGAVGNDSYMEPWLDESFAEYCEDVLYPLSGCESVQKAVKLDQERLQSSSDWGCQTEEKYNDMMIMMIEQMTGEKYIINDSYEAYSKENDSYSAHVYTGGSMFLYELQKAMGDGAFFHMLEEYYKMAYMKEVTTGDFVRTVKCFDDSFQVKKIINKYIVE